LNWKASKTGVLSQFVRFRHLNSGRLLAVKPIAEEGKADQSKGGSSKRGG